MPQNSAQLSIEDIYNLLMEHIEPDLTTDMVTMLDEIYAEETAKEKKNRTKRYAKALKKYAKNFRKAMNIWKKEYQKIQKKALALARGSAEKEEEKNISDIERSIENE